MAKGHFVEELTWPELERYIEQQFTAILPIGAGSKEHGLHLPLATDAIQVNWLCRQIIQSHKVLVWPTLTYGYYPAFTEFPGSTSLSHQNFNLLLDDVVAAIAGNGCHLGFILNSGISTIESVDRASTKNPVFDPLHIYRGEVFQDTVQRLCQQTNGGHADEVETSLMLHIAPDSVQLSQAVDESRQSFVAGRLNRNQPELPNHTASGAMGNPTLASAAKGRLLADAMLTDVRLTLDAAL